MGSNVNPTQAFAMNIDCSPQTDIKAPSVKTTHTQLTVYGKVKLIHTWVLHIYVLASLIQEGTLHASKREAQTPTEPKML